MSQGQFWAFGGSSSAAENVPSAASSSGFRRCVTSTTSPSVLLIGVMVGSSDSAAAAKRGPAALRCASCKNAVMLLRRWSVGHLQADGYSCRATFHVPSPRLQLTNYCYAAWSVQRAELTG